MQGQYQPYPQMPPGPTGPPYPPPPRRDKANLVPLFIVIGVLAVALLGGFAFIVVRLAGGGDGGNGTSGIRTTAAVNPRAVPAAFAGTWSGDGYYHNDKKEKRNFTANISLTEGAETGTVNYTGFVCSGTLRIESATADRLTMYETITQGNEPGGNCEKAASGFVTLTTRADGTVLYSWYSSRERLESNSAYSQATLSRQQSGT